MVESIMELTNVAFVFDDAYSGYYAMQTAKMVSKRNIAKS